MSILSDEYIAELLHKGLLGDAIDWGLLNPASVDVRVGKKAKVEKSYGGWYDMDIPDNGYSCEPGEFLLVETKERFCVPNGYAVELRLKSTTARLGWDHNAALWIDPGFEGIITMELRNCLRFNPLMLVPDTPFAQAIVHKLIGHSRKPYAGRYQGAETVEAAKEPKR